MRRLIVIVALLGFVNVASTAWGQKARIGTSVPATMDSGRHDAAGSSVAQVFQGLIEQPGAPWIRLRLRNISLGSSDYIEITSARGKVQIIDPEGVRNGAAFTRYFAGDALTVALFVGPGATQSGFTVSEVHFGVRGGEAHREVICGGTDDRVGSTDRRVCQLRMVGEYCAAGPRKDDWCGASACPGGTCMAGTCAGGDRNGLSCDCPGSTCVGPETFVGTAFFIEKQTAACLLTAGHNLYRSGDAVDNGPTFPSVDDVTLHCEPFDPKEACTEDELNDGLEIAVQTVTGELASQNIPEEHDWALIKADAPNDAAAFLLDDTPTTATVTVVGYGSDQDNGADNYPHHCQQTHAAGGASLAGSVISHVADTAGGNSGSPIIVNNRVWGIHTFGISPCPAMGQNGGTWIGQDDLDDAIDDHCNAIEAPPLDHYKCYKIKKDSIVFPPTVNVQDQFTTETVEVKKAFLWCNPVNKNGGGIQNGVDHLLCYKIKGTTLSPFPHVQTINQFGVSNLFAKKPFLLCVPGSKTLLP